MSPNDPKRTSDQLELSCHADIERATLERVLGVKPKVVRL
jgi:hypothetical protein